MPRRDDPLPGGHDDPLGPYPPQDAYPPPRPARQTGGVPDGLLLGMLVLLLGLTVLVWTATGLAGLIQHGGWPDGVSFTLTPLALRQLVTHPHDLARAWTDTPAGQLSGSGLFWGLFIGQLMVLTVLTVFLMGVVTRWRAVRARRRAFDRRARFEAAQERYARERHPREQHAANAGHDLSALAGPPPGAVYAGPAAPAAGSPAPVRHADFWEKAPDGRAPLMPEALAEPAPAPAILDGTATPVPAAGGALPPGVPAPRAARQVHYGGPDTRRPAAVQAIRDAEGPALVVTSDPAVWADTKDARAKLGPVLVYDPGHLCDTPGRLHWSPAAGCEDADVAAARAKALLAPVRPHSTLDAAMADTAETLLRCWLHAAAVDGKPVRQVHRWAQGQGTQEAVRVLRTHPKAASGLAGLLEAALTAHPDRRDIARELTARALGALSSIHIREACSPNRADSLVLESFAAEGGTLYVVGEPIEDPRSQPGAMPLLTALVSYVVERGRRMAARSSDGRLDPPMALVLDDVAAVAPLPALPELLARGRDEGLPTVALLRSREQGRARWPQHEFAEAP